MPTQSTHPFIVLCVAIAMLVVPATGGLAGSTNADTAPATDAAALPYDGLVPAIEEGFAGQNDVSFSEAIELGQLVGQHQASALGYELALDQPVPDHDAPSEAVIALAVLHDVDLTQADLDQIQALDELDEPLRTELTDVIDAFLAFEAASGPSSTDTGPVMDHGAVFAARNHLLDAVSDLHQALSVSDQTSQNTAECAPITIDAGEQAPDLPDPASAPGPIALELEGCDTTYTTDYSLLVDVGGQDTYQNNAGGSQGTYAVPTAWVHAAALVDLGEGDDTYEGSTPSHDRGGINGGGAALGAGFLVDAGGNDTYDATASSGSNGANGGADFYASGFLLDAAGDDEYVATGARGTNGGGVFEAAGALLDVDGNDTYESESSGANGGGQSAGSGLLVDLVGDDSYTATDDGANGQAATVPYLGFPLHSNGLLFDGHGHDVYQDDVGGSGTDKTVAPKGTLGAQIDTPPAAGN